LSGEEMAWDVRNVMVRSIINPLIVHLLTLIQHKFLVLTMYTWILLFKGGSVKLCGGGEEDRREYRFNQLGLVSRANGGWDDVIFAMPILLKMKWESIELKILKYGYCTFSWNNTTLKGHISAKHHDTEQRREIRQKLRTKCYYCKTSFASFECLRINMACQTRNFLEE